MTTAHARTNDPSTSLQAAASVTGLNKKQAAVYECLRLMRSATDERLVEAYGRHRLDMGWPLQSESGVRSRRAELVRKGLVVEGGFSHTQGRRRCTIWRAA